jgi:hypothetical protein
LGEEQVAELKEAFELFDSGRQGVLKKDSLKNTLKQFGTATNPTIKITFIFKETIPNSHGQGEAIPTSNPNNPTILEIRSYTNIWNNTCSDHHPPKFSLTARFLDFQAKLAWIISDRILAFVAPLDTHMHINYTKYKHILFISINYLLLLAGVFVSSEQLDEMFAEADATGSGSIGFPEFMSMMGRRMKQV